MGRFLNSGNVMFQRALNSQIYVAGPARDYGRALMVGIAYDPASKEHSCAMRELRA